MGIFRAKINVTINLPNQKMALHIKDSTLGIVKAEVRENKRTHCERGAGTHQTGITLPHPPQSALHPQAVSGGKGLKKWGGQEILKNIRLR